jgi:tRNA(Ile)-lysidine synthase
LTSRNSSLARKSSRGGAFGSQWLIAQLADLLAGFPDVKVLVAYSGGVDSTALLAALAQARPPGMQLRAIHVDHGIHPDSRHWSEHCKAAARALGVPIDIVATKVVRRRGESLEAAARAARYALLGRALGAGEFLLTAHHEDDQLETVLLQLFRGSGLAGLAAMPPTAPFASGWLVRPLLGVPRAKLEQWVRSRELSWIDDDSNADHTLDRNYLRHRVLPLVRERWKGVASAVGRSARHAAEAQHLLDALALEDVETASYGDALFVPSLRALQPARRRNALRFWIDRAGVRAPDTSRLEELAGPVIAARPDANPRVVWEGVEVLRHADLLSIRRMVDTDSRGAAVSQNGIEWPWKRTRRIKLWSSGGTLELKSDPHGPIDLDVLPEAVIVRPRKGGERLRPRRSGPRRTVKSLLQESRVSITNRSGLPLIFSGTELLAVGALWVDESIQPTSGTVRRGRLVHRELT